MAAAHIDFISPVAQIYLLYTHTRKPIHNTNRSMLLH